MSANSGWKCGCRERINEKLREQNLRLSGMALVPPSYQYVPFVQTDWNDREKAPRGQKNNPPYMLASHCPWCGVKIEVEKEDV